jgi:hypothetical protein
VHVLLEIARRLDMHPADLVPELGPLLSSRREPAAGNSGPGLRADALTVLTALATAAVPLTADQLARALGWQLPRAAAAITAARDDPGLAGPLAVRRIPPGAWTLSPRLDTLTVAQRRALRDTAGGAAILEEGQARVLLTALACGRSPAYASFRAEPGWAAAETALKAVGLLCAYADAGPHRADVSDDVKFSLRYCDDTHIARELGEDPPPAPAGPAW